MQISMGPVLSDLQGTLVKCYKAIQARCPAISPHCAALSEGRLVLRWASGLKGGREPLAGREPLTGREPRNGILGPRAGGIVLELIVRSKRAGVLCYPPSLSLSRSLS